MYVDGRLVLICGTVVILAVLAAIQFRYETHNKAGWGTARFDRWTGKTEICHEQGCYSEEELRNAAEQAQAAQRLQDAENQAAAETLSPVPETAPAKAYKVTSPFGAELLFPAGTEPSEIEATIKRVDACGRAADSQSALDECYRPSVTAQLEGRAYRLVQNPIYDPTQKQE